MEETNVLTLVGRQFDGGPGEVGRDDDQLAGVGPDEGPPGDHAPAVGSDVGLTGTPHDGGYCGAESVAGRGGWVLRERCAGPHEGDARAAPGSGRLGAQGEIALGNHDARPAGSPTLRGVLQLAGAGGEEEDDVADDDPASPIGSAADLADHPDAEVSYAEPGALVSKDDGPVLVHEGV